MPLYFASYEAKKRGEVSSRQALNIFIEGHGIPELLELFPYEMREEMKKDIKKKGWGFFFGEPEKKE